MSHPGHRAAHSAPAALRPGSPALPACSSGAPQHPGVFRWRWGVEPLGKMLSYFLSARFLSLQASGCTWQGAACPLSR